VTETITTGPVPETITTSISRRGRVPSPDADLHHDGSNLTLSSRFRCRRAGALSFERWGQVNPESAPAKRPRRAGGLSQARWRNVAGAEPTSQRPIVIEALPSDKALASNALHAVPRGGQSTF
jgi:hypothetical protein